jgi:hypothetical protein
MSDTTLSLFDRLAKKGKREILDLDGDKVEIVEMSFSEREQLGKLHSRRQGEDEDSLSLVFIRMLVYNCCYVPGTKDRVFASAAQVGDLPQDVAVQLAERVRDLNGLNARPVLEPDPDVEEEMIHEPTDAEKNA